jgi:hypothetical protein
MAEEILVGDQLTADMIAAGAGLVAALDRRKLFVKAALWLFLPEERAWRLVVASPEVRLLGPKAVYRKIRAAVNSLPAGVLHVGIKDVSVVDDRAPLVELLRRALVTGPGISGIRFTRNVINGQMIEDAYIYRLT